MAISQTVVGIVFSALLLFCLGGVCYLGRGNWDKKAKIMFPILCVSCVGIGICFAINIMWPTIILAAIIGLCTGLLMCY
jgi:hypothetical protein